MNIQNSKLSLPPIESLTAENTLNLPNTEWNYQVSDTTGNMSMINNDQHIYIGANGCIYKLDAETGSLLETNNLPAPHNDNVMMAISENGKSLYAGTAGYVIGIDTDNFGQSMWHKKIEKSNKNVSLVCHGDRVYAACHGYAYLLDATTGNNISTNKLKGAGFHDCCLALSEDGDTLYVGTDGYVYRIATNHFSKQTWRKTVNSSSDIVSLLLKNEILYAACHNHAYKLNANTGDELSHLNISDAHSKPLSLAITPDGKRLFIGVSGDVISVQTDTFSTIDWRTSLTSEQEAVSFLVDGDIVNTGCIGYLLQLDIKTGQIIFKRNFPGIGKHAVAMTKNEAASHLYFASGGYVIAMNPIQLLNAGWDFILAEKLTPMNKQLRALYDAQKLPHQLAGVELGCPQVTTANTHNQQQLTFSISVKGTIKKLFTIHGSITASIDLNQVKAELINQSDNEYTLQINFADQVISDIDLSQLDVKFLEKPIDIEQQHNHITELLNQAIGQLGSIEFPLNIALPVSSEQSKVGLAYVYNRAHKEDSFVALMIGDDDTEPKSPLSVNTIPQASACEVSIIISNLTIMKYIEKSLYQVLEQQELFVGSHFMSLDTHVYPALVSNNETSKESEYACGAAVKIEKGQLNSQFSPNGQLVTHLNLRYKEIIIKVSHTYHITLKIGFSEQNGELHLSFDNSYDSCSGGTTCSYIKDAVKKALNEFHDLFSDGFNITVPAIEVQEVQSPGYIQISGTFKDA